MAGTSVAFNGLMVPASTLAASLSRYVDNLFVWNDHETYKVSLVGSAVPIQFFGRYFLLCTNHQLRGCQLDRVSLLGRDGINLVTSSGVRQFNDEANLDLAMTAFKDIIESVSSRGMPHSIELDEDEEDSPRFESVVTAADAELRAGCLPGHLVPHRQRHAQRLPGALNRHRRQQDQDLRRRRPDSGLRP